jgi:outer membrane protein OmpA-like peptidoglycan-associated protein
MFKHIQNISLQVSLKSLLACGLIAISATQVNAEQSGQNIPLPAPTWNAPIPITWGECIPVPIEPMPPLGNNMAMPYAPAPAPMLSGPMPPAPYLAPPPGPFFDVAPAAPLPLVPLPPAMPIAACDDNEDKLNTLQEHYNLAAAASRKKIEELTQTLKDSQNQLQDSIASLEIMSKNKASNQADTNALANTLARLKQTSEAMISMKEKENTDLKKQLEALKNRLNVTMESSKSQAQKLMALGSANKDLGALKKQLADATTNNQALKIKLNELLKSSADRIKESTTTTEKALAEAKQSSAKVQSLSAQLNSMKKQFDAVGMQLNGAHAENQKLKAQLAALKADDENKNKTIFGLKQSSSQLAQIQQAYQAQQNKTKALEQQLQQLAQLKAELDRYKTNAANLQKQRDAQVAETEALKKQLAELRAANKDTQAKLAKFIENDENKNKTIFGLKQSASLLPALQDKTKTLEQQLAKLEAELSNCKTSNEALTNKNTALQNTSDSQTQKLTACDATASELEQLKTKYQSLSAANQKLEAQLADATADSDKDGVIDKSDKCPFSPEGAVVNALGCVADKDKDGIADSIDKCPSSPLGSHVNEQGCPKAQETTQLPDTDKDGVANADDLCPESAPGASVNEFGCTASENITLKGVNFKLGSARLTAASLPILDAAAETLKKNPGLKIEIAGHTDNQGFTGVNKRLSQRRANTVMIYLIRKGVKAENLTAKGYGEKQPITANDSKANRAINRRVELKILK